MRQRKPIQTLESILQEHDDLQEQQMREEGDVWLPGLCAANAQPDCAQCFGLGRRVTGGRRKPGPCACVLRAAFRACFARFRVCLSGENLKTATTPRNPGARNRSLFGLPEEEFMADFVLTARRTLCGGSREQVEADTRAYNIFRFHFLLGAEWKPCCAKLGMNRGDFFHEVYRIEQVLGRAFAELEPYALWPVDEYFGAFSREVPGSSKVPVKKKHGRLSNIIPFPVQQHRQRGAEALRDAAAYGLE